MSTILYGSHFRKSHKILLFLSLSFPYYSHIYFKVVHFSLASHQCVILHFLIFLIIYLLSTVNCSSLHQIQWVFDILISSDNNMNISQNYLFSTVYCSSLNQITNGQVNYTTPVHENGYILDTIAHFNCDSGYRISDPSVQSIQCEQSIGWSGQTPRCIKSKYSDKHTI